MLQLLEPLHIRSLQSAVLRLPLAVGGGTDPVVPPDLVDRAARIGFFQNGYNLCFGELRLALENLLARVTIVPESSPFYCLDLRGAYTFLKATRSTEIMNLGFGHLPSVSPKLKE